MIVVHLFKKNLDAFNDRFYCMEMAGRETLLDENIIHLTIQDAVLHAQSTLKRVSRLF